MKRWQITLVLIIAILTSVWLLTRNNFHAVIDGSVYRSAQLSPETLVDKVQDLDIKTVVSLRRPRPNEDWYKDEKAAAASLGIAHHDIAMDLTFSPRIDHLLELRDLLQSAPKPLLVHCRAGADRTGLAAMMTRLLDGTSTLDEVRSQVSWKYHAVRSNSMGIPFFEAYAGWLNNQGAAHSSEKFNFWLENEYQDLSGNIHFLVDAIEGQLWQRPWGLIEEGHTFEIDRQSTPELKLTGWAFDTRNTSLLSDVTVRVGDTVLDQSWYGIHQPWLINDFGKTEYLNSGWAAIHAMDELPDGCHDLFLTFRRQDGSSWTTPPAGRICIR